MKNKIKRISITVDKEQIDLLNKVHGFGEKDAEKVKNILIAYLSEKGYLEEYNKKKTLKNYRRKFLVSLRNQEDFKERYS